MILIGVPSFICFRLTYRNLRLGGLALDFCLTLDFTYNRP